jgi:hypothetical protein
VTGARLHAALARYDRDGAFNEDDYAALREAVADVGRVPPAVLDGFIGLFFERHVLDDTRRGELLAMTPDEQHRAVRFRFKQVVAGSHDSQQAWHALSAHVRDALQSLTGPSPHFPSRIATAAGFSGLAVEQAVAAVWGELSRRPTPREATVDLFKRYLAADPASTTSNISRELPAVVNSRLDAQRLARGVLTVLSDHEKDLLRSQIDGEGVEQWAARSGVSRATAYRMLSRVKALCRTEFESRTNHTRLEVIDAIRRALPNP